jgi:hypothetical protein
LEFELPIVVVGYNGENRRYSEARNDREETLASGVQHGWTQVIEADKVLGWIGSHLSGHRLSAARINCAWRN